MEGRKKRTVATLRELRVGGAGVEGVKTTLIS